jgi:WD40 repeat protein
MAETLTSASETVAPGGAGYDAFISYSHAADGQLAPALQAGLQALGKPWYRRRALRVFRDKTSLSATPELWPTIERALAGSRYFVVLASPEAAASRWVDQEVGWWREHRSPSGVLIGLTGGELAWDEARQAFDPARTTALPPAAFGWFAREPLWVDLRWAREVRHVSLRHPRFREGVADLAAPIRQLPKDELIGEDIRQHRRALGLARGAVTSLILLTVLAVVAASVAVGQRNDAQEQTRLATARQVAATATAGIPQRLDLSLLFAVQAYRQRRTAQTEAALFQAATASPHLVRFADNGTPVTALTPFRDGTQAATGGEDGTVRVWDLTGGRHPVLVADFDQQVTAVDANASGRHLLVGGAGGLVAVVDTTTREVAVLQREGRRVTAVALDPAGVRAGVLDDAYRVTVFDVSRQRAEASAESEKTPSVVAFRAGGTELMLGTGLGETSRWSVSPLRRRSNWTGMETPANDFTAGYSDDGKWFGYYKFGVVVKNTGAATPKWRNHPLSSRAYASVLAIAPDASRVAVASGGTISVVQADLPYEQYGDASQEGGMVGDPLPGVGTPIDALAFVGGRERLVSASQRLLVLWDLRQQSRIARPAGPDLADHVEATTRPGLAVSPRDGMVASAGDDGSLALWDPRTRRAAVRARGVDVHHGLWFSPDGSRLLVAGGTAVSIWELSRQAVHQVGSWPYPQDVGAIVVAPTPDGSTVLVVGDDGSVSAVATSNGLTKKVVAGGERYSIGNAALHPDGSEALLIDNAGTRLVNLRTGEARPGPAFGIPVQSAAYSRDGWRLAATDGGASVLVWDTKASRVVRPIAAERVDRMTFSPGGDRLVTITGEGRMALWDVASGVRLGDLRVLQHAYLDSADVGFQTELAWDPDGSALWTATLDGTVVRWALDPTEWIRSACAAAGQSLTADDWQDNIGSRVPDDLTCHA